MAHAQTFGAMKLEANIVTTSNFKDLKVQLHVADLHTIGKHPPPVIVSYTCWLSYVELQQVQVMPLLQRFATPAGHRIVLALSIAG